MVSNARKPSGGLPFFDVLLHCHNAKRVRRPDGRYVVGPAIRTEVALLEFAVEHGLAPSVFTLQRMGELALRRRSQEDGARCTGREGRLIAFTKGGTVIGVVALCTRTLVKVDEALPK